MILGSWRHSATSRLSRFPFRSSPFDMTDKGSVHSATLGKGKSDDTIKKVQNGDLRGKGEVVMVFGKQVCPYFLARRTVRDLHGRTHMWTELAVR